MKEIKIKDRIIGINSPTFITAEIGINHNGDLNLAKKMIERAASIGCDAVKFQKRTINIVYSKEELNKPRKNPFGDTNRDLKKGLEFGIKEYEEIDKYCKKIGIMWFASCWDEESVDFIDKFDPPCYKIASASLTDDNLLKYTKSKKKPIILSTGMSTINQIDHAVEILNKDNLIILHCTSTYPSKLEEINLKTIQTLKNRYKCLIGYSGHEVGISTTIAAATLGAVFVERHLTMDRSLWGSDQSASVEPKGFEMIVKYIRSNEKAMGDGIKVVYDSELPIIDKLRRI